MIDHGLLLDFFLSFGTFEYALKNTGFDVHHPENPGRPIKAEPDWDRFAAVRNNLFHGGKHANTLHEAEERATELLRSGAGTRRRRLRTRISMA